MNTIFKFSFGRFLRYILFVPVLLLTTNLVIMVSKLFLAQHDTWAAVYVLPAATGAYFGSFISSIVYPGVKKKSLTLVYFIVYLIICIIGVIIFFAYSKERIVDQIKSSAEYFGILLGYFWSYQISENERLVI